MSLAEIKESIRPLRRAEKEQLIKALQRMLKEEEFHIADEKPKDTETLSSDVIGFDKEFFDNL